ncbi:uncharacterized protein N7482_003447, partial [Penicillium canariense]
FLFKGSSVVNTPIPCANGEIANCTKWYAPRNEYDTCFSVLHSQQLEIAEFHAMNPSVKSDCSGMSIGTYYCVSTYKVPVSSTPVAKSTPVRTGISTPYPIQTGMVSTCDKFYKVVADDSCVNIANEYGISTSSFYAWNLAVKTDCSGLQADEYVCVAVA